MIEKITLVRNNGLHGIRVDAITASGEKIGITRNRYTRHGYFVSGKPVRPGHAKNKYFNDFVTLLHEAVKHDKN